VDFLDEEKVRAVLRYEDLLPAMEQALIGFSTGKIRQPLRGMMRLPEQEGILGLMPAADGEYIAVKLVTVYERNVTESTHQAVIQLFSATTGRPLVAIDGRLITEMRTAAVSAVATRLLARKDAQVLAILGSGVQARSHVRALRMVREFGEVRVWSRTAEHARRFAGEYGVELTATAEAAVREADVVVSATSTADPLVRGEWLAKGALVCAVGAVGRDKRELDDAAMQGQVVVESREAAMHESGDVIGSGALICAELGELFAGETKLSQTDSWVVFKSLGIGATDLAAARLVWERYQAKLA
jgi:thiomorpholine-carboxylate dehydrogenase